MYKSLTIMIAFLTGFLFGSEFQVFSGDIIQLDYEALGFRDCPGLVDSCIYVCSEGNTNPCTRRTSMQLLWIRVPGIL